jgi:hypothetical protein
VLTNVVAVSATGTAATVTTNAQPNITSVGTLTSLTVTGNISGGNISSTNLTGSLTTASQANITTVGTLGSLSVTGNINGGNITTVGTASIGGFTISGNSIVAQGPTLTLDPNGAGGNDGLVVVAGNLQVTGNVTYINSNTVTINDLFINVANNAATASAANGGGLGVGPVGAEYATLTYNSTSNIWNMSNGVSVHGIVQSASNITGGNILTGGQVSAAGNVYGVSYLGTNASLSGNVSGGNLITGGLITATGNITGGNVLYGSGQVSGTGSIYATAFVGSLTGTATNAVSATSATTATTAATVTSNAQANITSVGTLTGLAVTGLLSATGNVYSNSLGVGTAASGTTGEIRATNNITAYYSSDIKFKENVQEVTNALEIAEAIGSKTFDWTDEYIAEHGGEDGYFIQKSDFGVVAQDVQRVFPMAVRTRPDGTLAVDYEKLSTVAFGAVKQLKESLNDGNLASLLVNGDVTVAKTTYAYNADLAEMYCADQAYESGTVVEFGGTEEITQTTESHSTAIAGIISTAPSYLMNSTLTCECATEVALLGRVPCRVVGSIRKGDRLVASTTPGVATVLNMNLYQPGCIIGKALEDYNSPEVGVIEVAVGKI